MDKRLETFWSMQSSDLLNFFGTSEKGLTDAEAKLRLIKQGKNVISTPRYSGDFKI